MYRWMYKWKYGWINGHEWTDGRTGGQTTAWTGGQIEGWIQTEEWMDRRMHYCEPKQKKGLEISLTRPSCLQEDHDNGLSGKLASYLSWKQNTLVANTRKRKAA